MDSNSPILSDSDSHFFSKKINSIQENGQNFMGAYRVINPFERSIIFNRVQVKVQEGITSVLPETKKPLT